MSEAKKLSQSSNVLQHASNVLDIKEEVWKILDKNPLEKPLTICAILRLPRERYQNYITVLRSKWHKSKVMRYAQNAQKAEKHRVRIFSDNMPKSVSREDALAVGWKQSGNKNRNFFWKEPLGRIEWFETGKVIARISPPATWARGCQLVCNAFSKTGLIFDDLLMSNFLESFAWFEEHGVYKTAERLPYRVINDYVQSHGIRVVTGDLSHPHAIEVQAIRPDVVERFEQLQGLTLKLMDTMGRLLAQNSKALETDSKAISEFSAFLKDLSQPKKSVDASGMVV